MQTTELWVPPAADADAACWYFIDNNRAYRGPVSKETLRYLYSTKAITGKTYVFAENLASDGPRQWTRVHKLPELHEELQRGSRAEPPAGQPLQESSSAPAAASAASSSKPFELSLAPAPAPAPLRGAAVFSDVSWIARDLAGAASEALAAAADPADADVLWTQHPVGDYGARAFRAANRLPFEHCLVTKHRLAATLRAAFGSRPVPNSTTGLGGPDQT